MRPPSSSSLLSSPPSCSPIRRRAVVRPARPVAAAGLVAAAVLALFAACAVRAPWAGIAHADEIAAVPAPSPPSAVVEPSSLAFRAPGQRASVTIRNDGGSPLGIVRILLTGGGKGIDFLADNPGHRALAPGESLKIAVTYAPPAHTARHQSFAALVIHTDDPRLPADVVAVGPAGADGEARALGVALVADDGTAGSAHLLSWLIFAPLLGIPILLLWPRRREGTLRWIALGATGVPLALAAWVALVFDPKFSAAQGNFGYQLVEQVVWLRAFNVEYHLGVDGLSIGLVFLAAFITFIAVLASGAVPGCRSPRGYFALVLLLETGMLGVFVSLDFFLFYVFWEVVLLPMFFLIGLWGGPRKEYAAIKFFLYTLAGSVLILLAVLALYFSSQPGYLVDGTPAVHTLDLVKLAQANDFGAQPALLGFRFANLVWVLLFIGFAIKVPVVPLHTWLPDAHVEAPTGVSVILAAVLLKMGTYGMLRVSWAILPEATRWAAPGVAVLGAISVVYGAFSALGQKDLKGLVAYSSISHLGYCLLGMAALTPLGVEGAVFQMLSHGFISAMLFLLVGVLYDRAHERGLDAFGGVAAVMPRFAALFTLGFMAALGLPGLSGFIGELMALLGSFGPYRVATAVATLGLVVGAGYNLWAIRRVLLGVLPERWRAVLAGHDLTAREWATLLPLGLIVLGLGFYPAPVLAPIATAVTDLFAVMGVTTVGLGGGL